MTIGAMPAAKYKNTEITLKNTLLKSVPKNNIMNIDIDVFRHKIIN